MWKQLTAALMILAFTSSIFCRSVILVDYYANTAAYAARCINKARAAMHCNGKCQMMKKLEQEEKNNGDQEKKSDNKSELIFVDLERRLSLDLFFCASPAWPPTDVLKPIDKNYLFFRPPVAE
jgi:hypothetical protein